MVGSESSAPGWSAIIASCPALLDADMWICKKLGSCRLLHHWRDIVFLPG
ncbi:MAG: hypothetical protein WBW31_03070 [Candidatus Sulfotelmatobacter sp.]